MDWIRHVRRQDEGNEQKEQKDNSGSSDDNNGDKGNSDEKNGDPNKDGDSSDQNNNKDSQDNDDSKSKTSSSTTKTSSTSTTTTTLQTPKQKNRDSSTTTSTTSTSTSSTSTSTTTPSSKSQENSQDGKDSGDGKKDSSKTTATTTTATQTSTSSAKDSTSSDSDADSSNSNRNKGSSDNGDSNDGGSKNGDANGGNSKGGDSRGSDSNSGDSSPRPKPADPPSTTLPAAPPPSAPNSAPSQTIPPVSSLVIDTSTGSIDPTAEPSISSLPVIAPIATPSSLSVAAARSSTSSAPAQQSALSQSSQGPAAPPPPASPSLNSALIAGASVGAVAGFILLVALSVLCVRGKFRWFKAPIFHTPSFRSPFPPLVRRPSRAQSEPSFRSASPSPVVATAPQRPRMGSLPIMDTEKSMEPQIHEVVSEKVESPVQESYLDDVSIIDPGFMRELSTIMEASTERSVSQQSRPSQVMSFTESAYSRQSNLQSASVKSDSTIILPAPYPNHSRHASESGSMFGPSRINSAVGPWRDSIWSTTATPTAVLPPSSAYASQRQSRRSLSLSARMAQARDSYYWTDDQSPRASRRPPGSALLPPLPTPGLGRSPPGLNSQPSGGGAQTPSRGGSSTGPSWPLP